MRSDLIKALSMSAVGAALVAGVILAPAVAQDALPPGPGMEETMKGCGGCHGIGQILTERRSAEEWANTVTMMITNGAPVAEDEFDKVVGYLAAYFGTGPAPVPGAAPAAAAPVEGAAPAAPVTPGAPAENVNHPTGTVPAAGGSAPATPPVGNIPAPAQAQ